MARFTAPISHFRGWLRVGVRLRVQVRCTTPRLGRNFFTAVLSMTGAPRRLQPPRSRRSEVTIQIACCRRLLVVVLCLSPLLCPPMLLILSLAIMLSCAGAVRRRFFTAAMSEAFDGFSPCLSPHLSPSPSPPWRPCSLPPHFLASPAATHVGLCCASPCFSGACNHD